MAGTNLGRSHDPREIIRGLQQILISDAKKIGFLFGAGTSMAVKKKGKDGKEKPIVPGIDAITNEIVESITDEGHKCAIDEIKDELIKDGLKFQIENILSLVEQKARVIGSGILCGLDKRGLEELKRYIEDEIHKKVSVHNEELNTDSLVHSEFALWINQASRKAPVEIFTTNYDYLIEIGLEQKNVPYFDGFVGSYKPFFDPSIVEDNSLLPKWTRLWKLHGSLGWEFDHNSKKIFRGNRDSGKIMVYPSQTKYDNSKKQPYVSFMDRLNSFVKEDDSVLVVCGYSFGDQHINATILEGLKKARTSHVIVFLYTDLEPNENSDLIELAKQQPKLSICGKRNAVIGGRYGKWKLKSTPSKDDDINVSLYFDEDGTTPDTDWTGEGDLKLVDYAKFIPFLVSISHVKRRIDIYGHQ